MRVICNAPHSAPRDTRSLLRGPSLPQQAVQVSCIHDFNERNTVTQYSKWWQQHPNTHSMITWQFITSYNALLSLLPQTLLRTLKYSHEIQQEPLQGAAAAAAWRSVWLWVANVCWWTVCRDSVTLTSGQPSILTGRDRFSYWHLFFLFSC